MVAANGALEQRSLVYTEYFARGTAPSAYCDLHPTRGFMDKFASVFTGNNKPPPPHVEDAGIPPPAPVAVTASAIPPAADGNTPTPKEPEKKKRGFFARIFGRRSDDPKSDRTGR